MIYTIYSLLTGEIEKTVSCSVEDVALQFDPSVSGTVEGSFQDDKFYIADGSPVSVGTPPSSSHRFDHATKQWIDPRTLQDLKDAKWAQIKQARTAAEHGGFTWDGSTFDSDAVSQNRITGAVTLAMLSPSFTIDWTVADNTVRTLSQADMCSVGGALGIHVGTQFAKAQVIRSAIDTAETKEAVEAIAWV